MNSIKKYILLLAVCFSGNVSAESLPYTIVDTGQIRCYSNNAEIVYPNTGTGCSI